MSDDFLLEQAERLKPAGWTVVREFDVEACASGDHWWSLDRDYREFSHAQQALSRLRPKNRDTRLRIVQRIVFSKVMPDDVVSETPGG